MEINCNSSYRIERTEGSHDVWVYRGRVRVMHLTQSCNLTDRELVRDVREILRILDM